MDLGRRHFVFVRAKQAEQLDNLTSEWRKVWAKIPEAKRDSRGAVESFAVDLHDACIFYVMRVAECGLRAIGRKLKVKLSSNRKNCPLADADWKSILDGLKAALTLAHQQPRGPKRTAQLKVYSDAAEYCLYLKELRNEVSHARKAYNQLEALNAICRVRDLMTLISGGLP